MSKEVARHIEGLKSAHWQVRREAAWALRKMKDPRAVESLIEYALKELEEK